MILEILLKCGGENEKYVLMPPTEASNTEKDTSQTSSGLMFEALDCPDNKDDQTNKPVEIENNTPSISITDLNEQQTHLTCDITDPEYGGNADDILLFDEVLKEKERSLQQLQTKYESLKSIYDNKHDFTINERKKFQTCRNELAKLTGDWLAEDILAGFSEWKREQLIGKGRCKRIGLEMVRSNDNLKQTIINQVKTKGAWKRITKNMKKKIDIPVKLVQLVDKELEHIGENHLKDTEGPKSSGLSNTFKNQKKKPKKPKKTGIPFVKGAPLDASDDSSGMEYSDEVITSEDEK